jgi:hypothetical protein
MRLRFGTLLLLLVTNLFICALLAAEKKAKPPEMEVLDVSVHRREDSVTVDGKVRNCGDKPVKKLVIQIDFLSPEKKVISTRQASIEQEVLQPGEEAEFHAQMPDEARATAYQVNFETGDGRYLRAKSEQRPIE